MSHFLLVGGLASSLVRFRGPLIDAALRAGHVVTCAAGNDDAETSESLRRRGVAFHPIALERAGSNPLADLRAMRDLLGLLRLIRPDVVLGYTVKPALYSVLASRLTGIGRPYAMLSGLGHALSGGSGFHASGLMANALARLALPRAERVIFHNDDDRLSCESRGLLPQGHSVVVDGSGIDLESFPTSPVPSGPITFLMVARLLHDKGIREFVEAARVVHARYPDVKFRVVGGRDANPRSVTDAELEEWKRSSPVAFVGPVSNPWQEFTNCHAFVLPSYREGLARTLLEAMAVGRAVITTDAPGCRDVVLNGNGLVVPIRDAEALANAMCALVDDRARVVTMGARGRELAISRFDARIVAERTLQTMGLVAERHHDVVSFKEAA